MVSIVDLGSTNGMLVNGQRVAQATLGDGATVKVGNTTLAIRFVPSREGGTDV
jgi:pSer/pThr/pTyr-binding forkhead associated (FHA) protein